MRKKQSEEKDVATPFIQINWQKGSVKKSGVNGCQVEDVIDVAIARLQELDAEVPSLHNRRAIGRLQRARVYLDRRTADRVGRGVEGTQEP